MEIEKIRKYIGKKVYLELGNGFKYTTIIKKVDNDSITFTDKYDTEINVVCSFIVYIKEAERKNED